MEKIPSFTIDHKRLLRGVYVSRKDITPSGDVITTFDVRMKEPNREPALGISALHTIEHLAATYLRNHKDWKDRIVYWGPMGCCTGNYLLVKGAIPGATDSDCGNYLLNNLPMAKWEARKYLTEVLDEIKQENLEYPK